MNEDVTVHSRVNRGMAIAGWVLLGVLGALVALGSEPRGVVAVVLGVLWVAYAAHTVLWAPSLTVDGAGATIRNPLRTIRVEWDALIHVDTRYSLTLHTPGRAWAVWCAPQASALVARRAARRVRADQDPLTGPGPHGAGLPVGELPGTESGDAARLVRERWAARPASDRAADDVAVRAVWHVGRLVALLAGPVLVGTVPLLLG